MWWIIVKQTTLQCSNLIHSSLLYSWLQYEKWITLHIHGFHVTPLLLFNHITIVLLMNLTAININVGFPEAKVVLLEVGFLCSFSFWQGLSPLKPAPCSPPPRGTASRESSSPLGENLLLSSRSKQEASWVFHVYSGLLFSQDTPRFKIQTFAVFPCNCWLLPFWMSF